MNLTDISVGDILGEEGPPSGLRGIESRALVLAFVNQHPDGVTVEQVAMATGLSERRVRQILTDLTKEREVYDRKLPKVKPKLYYPNGRLIHKYLQDSREFGSQTFRISFHDGRRTPRMQIQERQFTLLDGEHVMGAIWVDSDNVGAFVEFTEEMLARFNDWGKDADRHDEEA